MAFSMAALLRLSACPNVLCCMLLLATLPSADQCGIQMQSCHPNPDCVDGTCRCGKPLVGDGLNATGPDGCHMPEENEVPTLLVSLCTLLVCCSILGVVAWLVSSLRRRLTNDSQVVPCDNLSANQPQILETKRDSGGKKGHPAGQDQQKLGAGFAVSTPGVSNTTSSRHNSHDSSAKSTTEANGVPGALAAEPVHDAAESQARLGADASIFRSWAQPEAHSTAVYV
jgi:hypothetical protein